MLYNVCLYILLFFIYSFLGWVLEVIDQLFETKKLVNRGFLVGPICPIYGYGCLLIIFLLTRYMDNFFILFFMAILMCSLLEYFTSYFMEKIFNARWWDYSNKKFNINGRICLETMIPFGVLGSIILYIVNPFLISKLTIIPKNITLIVSIILVVVYIIDNVISFNIIFKFRNTMKLIECDGTIEITKKVKEVLFEKNWFFRRLIKAFPNIRNHKEILLDIQRKIDKELKSINNKINTTIKKVRK